MYLALMTLAFCYLLLCGCVSATSSQPLTTEPPNGALEIARSTLLKPEGSGPFPAVVIMHDCSGLGPQSSGSPMRWATELVKSGYVILIPDSFSTRGHAAGVCTDSSPSRNDVAPARRASDAYAALSYLRTLAFVDGARIGIMGGSHGGSTTLFTMLTPQRPDEPLAQEKRMGFRGAVALYPSWGIRLGEWNPVRRAGGGAVRNYVGVYKPVAPLLILIGENDDWTPAEPCRKLVEVARQAGFPV